MKAVIISRSDDTGGAAIVSLRLLKALRVAGVDARMLVCEKRSDSPFVERVASSRRIRRSFLAERLKIFLANGLNRSTLFKIDTASEGLPIHRHRLVKEADIILLAWVNQGMLSIKGINRLIETGKPIVWTMHDTWNCTGICHHPFSCRRFEQECGLCPLLGNKAAPRDISFSTWKKKKKLYSRRGIHFVAVSNWLARLARKSSLLADQSLSVIPNPFDLSYLPVERQTDGKLCLLFGAARLDNDIKGLPILIEATQIIKRENPQLADKMELLTFGDVKNPDALKGFGIEHRHLGRIFGSEALGETYAAADILVAPSLFENLPTTLIEAQMLGCVPVSFLRGGQDDIITDGDNGILVDFDDDRHVAAENFAKGILRAVELRKDKDLRSRMRKSVEKKFSAERVAAQYVQLFNRLLANGI